MNFSRNTGFMLLGIWLIAKGLMPLLHINFSGSGTVLSLLSAAAGVMLVFGK